jgi:hypothetical protein
MSDGVEKEMGACQLHDARHANRLAQLLERLRDKPVHRIPKCLPRLDGDRGRVSVSGQPRHGRAVRIAAPLERDVRPRLGPHSIRYSDTPQRHLSPRTDKTGL